VSPVRYGFEAIVINEFDSRQYNSTMILQSITKNYTIPIMNAFAGGANSFMADPNFNISDFRTI
jgi:hypothetical protein